MHMSASHQLRCKHLRSRELPCWPSFHWFEPCWFLFLTVALVSFQERLQMGLRKTSNLFFRPAFFVRDILTSFTRSRCRAELPNNSSRVQTWRGTTPNRTFLACCLQCRNPSCSRKCRSVSFLGRLISFECGRVCPRISRRFASSAAHAGDRFARTVTPRRGGQQLGRPSY